MKVSKQTMADHREKIIVAAAKRFRERGFDGISVADLMKEVGLTHGGFYRHFSSKEELVAIASARALNDSLAKWEKWIQDTKGDSVDAFAARYLSLNHLHHPEIGCLWAACGSELARQPDSVKEAVGDVVRRLVELFGGIVPGHTEAERKQNALAMFATMIGGMILARSVSDPALRNEILGNIASSVMHAG
jgi:TetR/AcrR family transcriptional regulator, transcriptional repressor for nem operon